MKSMASHAHKLNCMTSSIPFIFLCFLDPATYSGLFTYSWCVGAGKMDPASDMVKDTYILNCVHGFEVLKCLPLLFH